MKPRIRTALPLSPRLVAVIIVTAAVVGLVAAPARAAIEWTHLGLAGEAVKSIAFSPDWSVDRTLFATNFYYGSLYRSYDAGSTWQTTTPWGALQGNMNDVVFSPGYRIGGSDQRVFVGGSYPMHVSRSSDGGDNFTAAGFDLPWQPHVYDLAASAAFASDGVLFAGAGGGVLMSSDWGATFAPVNSPSNYTAYAMAISPAYPDDRTLFMGTLGQGAGVYQSGDGGATWQSGTGLPLGAYILDIEVSPDFKNDRTVFAAIENFGPYRSTDGGATWTAYGSWSAWRDSLIALAPNYGTDKVTFHNDSNGNFWMRGTAAWSRFLGQVPAWPNEIAADPDFEHNLRIYLATNNGIWTAQVPEPLGVPAAALAAGAAMLWRRRRPSTA